jgi:hypothetical protein
MISLDVSLDEKQIQFVRDALGRFPGKVKKATARAINRAVEGARTDAVKKVCEEYVIKPTDVRKTIHIVRAKPDKLTAQVISEGRPIPLIKFNVKPKKPPAKGTRVVDRKTVIAGVKFGSAKEMPHSFIVQMKSGHIGVFSRVSNAPRLPIEQKHSLSVPQMLGSRNVIDFIEKRAHERLDKELRHQITYLLGGGK